MPGVGGLVSARISTGVKACINVEKTLHALSVKEVKNYAALFHAIDVDKSGAISTEEIHSKRKKLGIETNSIITIEDWLANVDMMGDGEIQLDEFCVFMHIAKFGMSSPKLFYHEGKKPKEGFSFSGASWRDIVWVTLEEPSSSRFAFILSLFLVGLILVSVLSYCIETMEMVQKNADMMEVLGYVEMICTFVFSAEFLLRLASTNNHRAFLTSWLNIIDLVSILPTYLDWFTETATDSSALRIARLARVARVLKLGRYLVWLKLYGNALSKARFPLAMAFFVCMLDIIIFASLIFYTERGTFDPNTRTYYDENGTPSKFQSIFDGCYWAVITITTVGYGEIVPVSSMGRFVGVVCLFTGNLLLAIPISIFSTHFHFEYTELKKQKQRELQKKREEESAQNIIPSSLVHKLYSNYKGELFNAVKKVNSVALARKATLRLAALTQFKESSQDGPVESTEEPDAASIQKAALKAKIDQAERDQISPRDALVQALAALEKSDLNSLQQRNLIRKEVLKTQVQRVVDLHREQLWVEFRLLERKFREQLMSQVLEKYAGWFLQTDEDLEKEIVHAVLKIQTIFRGNMARMLLSSKLVAWGNRARRSTTHSRLDKLLNETDEDDEDEIDNDNVRDDDDDESGKKDQFEDLHESMTQTSKSPPPRHALMQSFSRRVSSIFDRHALSSKVVPSSENNTRSGWSQKNK